MLRRRAGRYVARTQLHNRLGSPRFPWLNHIILASIILGLLYSLFVLRDFRRSLTVFLSFKEIFRMGHEISVARYSGVYVYSSLPTQIILSFVYVGPIFSGLSFSLNLSRSHRLIAFLSIVPALIAAVIQTTRAAILFSGILWMASYFSGRVLLERGTVHLFAKKHVLLASFLIPLLVVVLIILLMARGNMMSLDEIPSRFLHLRSDFWGHLSVFSHWFQYLWYEDITPYFGACTFGGLFSRLGIRLQELKLYGEAIEVGPGQMTNLYTLFLPLIKDFTPVGALEDSVL